MKAILEETLKKGDIITKIIKKYDNGIHRVSR